MTDTEVKAPKIEFPNVDYPVKVISDTGVGNKDKIIDIVKKHATVNDDRVDERQIKAGLAEDLSMTMPKGEMKKLTASMTMNPQLVAPIAKGDVIGKVEVKLEDKVVHSADLIALDGVEEGGIFRRMWDSIRLFFYSLFN